MNEPIHLTLKGLKTLLEHYPEDTEVIVYVSKEDTHIDGPIETFLDTKEGKLKLININNQLAK